MNAVTVIGRKSTETRAHTLLNNCSVSLVLDSRTDKVLVAGGKWKNRRKTESYFIALAEQMDKDGFTTDEPLLRELDQWEVDRIEEIAGLPHALSRIDDETRDLLMAA